MTGALLGALYTSVCTVAVYVSGQRSVQVILFASYELLIDRAEKAALIGRLIMAGLGDG